MHPMHEAELVACRHRDCGCRTRSESGYCSPYCENVEREAHPATVEGEQSACSCGHAGCVVAPRATEMPDVGPDEGEEDEREEVAVSIGHRPETEPPLR